MSYTPGIMYKYFLPGGYTDTGCVNGKAGAWLQPIEFGITEQGAFSNWTYQGTSTEILAMRSVIESFNGLWTIKASATGGNDTLTARMPVGWDPSQITDGNPSGLYDLPEDIWELTAEEIQLDLFQCPIAITLTLAEQIEITNAVSNPGISPAPTDDTHNAVTIYNLMMDGVRSQLMWVPILRHTRTYSNGMYTPPVDPWNNVGALLSNDCITEAEGPSIGSGNGEGCPVASDFTLPVDTATARTNYAWAWLKKAPDTRVGSRSKTQVVKEFRFAMWSTGLYGSVITS
jgi:hypothetical protein